MVVSRVGKEHDLGRQIVTQMFISPRVLGIAAGILGVLGVLPSTPMLTLIAQLCTLGYFGFFVLLFFYSKNESTKPLPERVTFK